MKKTGMWLMALLVAACICPIGANALTSDGIVTLGADAYDEDDDTLDYATFDTSNGEVSGEAVPPGSRFYIEIVGTEEPAGSGMMMVDWANGNVTTVADLVDKDYFTFRLDKDQNGSLVDSVKLVNKRLGGGARSHYIEVKLDESRMTEEKHVTFDAYFRAKQTMDLPGDQVWQSGDVVSVRFSLFVENPEEETDASIETGEGVVFNPTSNDENLITWGYDGDIACLEFEADNDADKFYAKLSTKNIRSIYDDYGDPADADLYFRTFEGRPSIDSTSRATLTLYNPWDDAYNHYYDYDVNPRDCYIYLVDKGGYLSDITNKFDFVRGEHTDAGIDGWQLQTRSLGTYVISDVPLALYEEEEPVGEPQNPENLPAESTPTPPESVPITPAKPSPPPSTGAADLLAPAMLFAALALGAVALARTSR